MGGDEQCGEGGLGWVGGLNGSGEALHWYMVNLTTPQVKE